MLKWFWQLLDDPATVESRLLRQLLGDATELPEWSLEVQRVLTRLLDSNRIRRPMVCRVLDMPVFNALALPHKTIVLSRSFVEFCRDERHQIAFVLAHEAAHIHLGHAWDRSRANALVSLLRTANPLVGVGMRMLLDRAYSREQEFEADKLAVNLAARAGYAPEGAMTLLTRLAGLAGTSNSVVRQLLSTHPPVKERIGQLQDRVRQWQDRGSA
jgi:Zn-dependent protease with chaperone function